MEVKWQSFGERVMYLKSGSKGIHKLECRWEEGIWVGMRIVSHEHYIVTEMVAHHTIKDCVA